MYELGGILMGFLERIFGPPKEDYATQFKKCIEEGGLSVATCGNSILKNWRAEYPNDANRYYAVIIFEKICYPGEVSFNELTTTLSIAKGKTPVNKELAPWYKSGATELLFG